MKMSLTRLNFWGMAIFSYKCIGKGKSCYFEEVNVLACLVAHMDSIQLETYEAAIQMRQEKNTDAQLG